MGTKSASIKLTLDASAFKSGLKAAGADGEGVAKGIGTSFSKAMTAGVKGGVDAVKGAFSTLKSTILSIGGIAGGIGIAELARGALQTESTFRKLAFSIKAGGNAGVDFRTVMQGAQKVALETGHSADDLGKTMQQVFTETGNADFAQKSIADIAVAATGAHEPLETMGAIAGTLNKKFGITSDQIQETLATVVGLGNKGGVSVAEMGEKLGLVGAFAKEAGLSGQAGFSQMIGLMNVADQSTGTLKKGISAVGGILETLGTTASRNKAMMQLGIDPSKAKGDIQQTIGEILKKTGGSKDKLAVAFQGEQLKVLADLGKNYATVFSETKGDVKTKTAAALEAYQEALRKAGGSSTTFADLQKEAGAEMQTPAMRLKTAITKLENAFASDKIQAALGKLFDVLPKIADMIASVVGFASDHPVAAGALAVGGVAAQGFGGAALSSLLGAALRTGGQTAATAISGAMTQGGASAALSLTGAGTIVAAGLAAAVVGAMVGEAVHDLVHGVGSSDPEKERMMRGETIESGQDLPGEGKHKMFRRLKQDENGNFLRDEKGNVQEETSATNWATKGALANFAQNLGGRVETPGEESGTGTRILGEKAGDGGAAPAIREALSRTLRVEVTNAADIRAASGPGGPGGAPVPGNQPRR